MPRRRLPLLSSLFLTLAMAGACAHGPSNLDQGLDAKFAGDDEAAERFFRAALTDEEDSNVAAQELDELLLRRARAMVETDPQGALALYQSVLEDNPSSHRARMGAGRSLEVLRRFDEAIDVLTVDPQCKACRGPLAEVYEQKGRAHVADDEFDLGAADFARALEIERDPAVLIDVSELYTGAQYGTATDAAKAIVEARDLIPSANTVLQELWVVERRDLALAAAAHHDKAALDLVLSVDDPRIALDQGQRDHALLELRLEVARTLLEHAEYDAAVARARACLDDAEATLEGDSLTRIKEGVMGIYSRKASRLLAMGEARAATKLLGEALGRDPEHLILRYQTVLAWSGIDLTVAEQMISKIPESTEHWHRVHALIRTARAQRILSEGDMDGARAELFAAGKEFPDLLEVRLVKAEILAQMRISEVARADAKFFRKHAEFHYPEGIIRRYGEALGEVMWARNRFQDEFAQRSPFRMPGFAARLSALETELRSFYPYEVRRIPGAEPRLRLKNEGATALAVVVQGVGTEHNVTVAAGGEEMVVMPGPGLVLLTIGEGEAPRLVTLFGEPKTLIEVPLVPLRAPG